MRTRIITTAVLIITPAVSASASADVTDAQIREAIQRGVASGVEPKDPQD